MQRIWARLSDVTAEPLLYTHIEGLLEPTSRWAVKTLRVSRGLTACSLITELNQKSTL